MFAAAFSLPYASADVYFFNSLGGIRPSRGAVAFDSVVIRPLPPPASAGLAWLNASITTVRGIVNSSWTLDEAGHFTLTTVTPPNMAVEVILPDGSQHRPGSGEHVFSCTMLEHRGGTNHIGPL
jgi:hypothetical protein